MSRSLAAAAWPWVRRVLLVVGGTYLALGALLWFFQRRLIYFPEPGPVPPPPGPAWARLEQVEIASTDGVTLHAWYLPGTSPVSILLLHGNAGHRGHRADLLRALARRGYSVLIPDYRGYGGSTGEPDEDGLYADAEASLAWLRGRAAGPIVYMGNSLGTGVAVELARRAQPAALVLRSAFSSIGDVGQAAYPFFPVRPFLRDRFDSASKIAEIGCPLLCVHGADDDIIPARFGRALFDKAAEPKRWLAIPGAGHNDLESVAGETYWNAVAAFLDEHVVR